MYLQHQRRVDGSFFAYLEDPQKKLQKLNICIVKHEVGDEGIASMFPPPAIVALILVEIASFW